MNGSLIPAIRETARAGLSIAGKLLGMDLPLSSRFTDRRPRAPSDEKSSSVPDGDLPLCSRFTDRRPRALSDEKSSSKVQKDACESASISVESSSRLPGEKVENKRKRDTPTVNCFTPRSLSQGHGRSQITDRSKAICRREKLSQAAGLCQNSGLLLKIFLGIFA